MSWCKRLGLGSPGPSVGSEGKQCAGCSVLSAAEGEDLPVFLLSHRLLAAVPQRLVPVSAPSPAGLVGVRGVYRASTACENEM